ncbi:MAG: tRNA 4-thiouridine(8) synthase ThiI [Candidatus Pacearchaeota archaeon]|nr:tRNA 4-thiouridine(8) synthase ThiI [Candidatus Pacearchaeota archaeon]
MENNEKKYAIIRYSEIAIKGKNRRFFEDCLLRNLKIKLKGFVKKISKRYGKIICEIKEGFEDNIRKTLENMPGVANFSFAIKTNLEIEEIKKKTLEFLIGKKFDCFKVETSRANKKFYLISEEVNKIIGKEIIDKTKKKVDLENPDIVIYIDIEEKEAHIYDKKIKGIGGLPVGASGKVVCSLSGGIDSPVASFFMMKRGCEVVFAHMFNFSKSANIVMDKIEKIVKELNKFQLKSKIYFVPFEKIQKEIITKIEPELRMIIYRRFMMKIINAIVKKEGAKAIITGDSIGQVASQTLENINSIYDAVECPVLCPLIGMNKEEIIDVARKIKTFEISSLNYPDCCSFMIAKHPKTKSFLKEIREKEKKIKNEKNLIEVAIKNARIELIE